MATPIEAVFYIHGVSPDQTGRLHTNQYNNLHSGIAPLAEGWPEVFGGAEWGWNHQGGTPEDHELLTTAQRLLGSRALPALKEPWDFTANPARAVINGLRELYLFGFGDIFYYVSSDGKQSIRQAVAEQLYAYLENLQADGEARPISLTLIGHSAGSVIAFDLLFYLFQEVTEAELVTRSTNRAEQVLDNFAELRQLALAGSLRVRRLITLGSLITPMACRNNEVLAILAADRQLDPKNYGLTANPDAFEPLDGPRWINVWDRDDPIAWPVEPLMQQSIGRQVVEDLYVDVSDVISQAHNKYWNSGKVHREVAKRW
ncbi:hypothetical protein KFU94_64065 [Chloroflexi bacterium TSY]|nr:hypothetical protein [Chloroflexi bacterium TSY]